MSTVITAIDAHSPAEKAGIQVGEKLLTINGHEIIDVLDYRFYGYDAMAKVALQTKDGKQRSVAIEKDEGADLGLNFDTYLMDEMRPCSNHCIFCFVDQMPPNMRQTLYFKDDDARLSFLLGNYITLTNLSEREAQRIIDLRISPINVSVHTTDPRLHCTMLGNKDAEKSLRYMKQFGQAGIEMNGQIVICPGWNDGDALRRTLSDLIDIGFHSCSLVPVGLTKFRKGLSKLNQVDAKAAGDIIDIADEYGDKCLKAFGTRRFFCADELYIKAGRPLPEDDYYEAYQQLENGVGMLRSLMSDFRRGLNREKYNGKYKPFTIATGRAAEPFLRELVKEATAKVPGLRGEVVGIDNDFFGHTIDVSGLLTGQDLIAQLKDRELGERVLLTHNVLRYSKNVLLDDVSVPQIEQAIGCPVEIVGPDGYDLLDALFEEVKTHV
jgi:putative radical SAM enzyme (TIGR03279 family)